MQHHAAPIFTRVVGSSKGYIWRSQCFTPYYRQIHDGAGDVIISSRDYETAVATRKELTPTGHIRNSYCYNIWHPGSVWPTHFCLRTRPPHCRLLQGNRAGGNRLRPTARGTYSGISTLTKRRWRPLVSPAGGWWVQWRWLQGTGWARSLRKVSHHVTASPSPRNISLHLQATVRY